VNGRCFFLDEDNRCKIYEYRPLGCRIYPIVLDLERGAVVDDLCPKKNEIREEDIRRVEPILRELVRRIYGLKV
jgi:Fe-S-cluster containining protein